MTQYRNLPEGFTTVRKQLHSRAIPVILISMIGGLAICYFSENMQNQSFYVWAVMIFFLIAIMLYAFNKAIKTQKAAYESYELTIATDYLSRKQNGLPIVTIPFSEITQITEDKNGLRVKGITKGSSIAISVFIENYLQIKDLLQSIKPISLPDPKNFLDKSPFLVALFPVALMIAVYTSNNKLIVGIAGSALIILMLWCFYKMQTTPQISKDIKSKSWMLFIVIASTIAIIYYKVFGT